MNLITYINNRIYKWIMIYPQFRKIIVWLYSNLLKLPQYHIGLSPKDIGLYVFLVENPDDVIRFASYLDQAKEMSNHREYLSYTGKLDGADVTIISTGIGGPSTAIAIEELSAIGAKVFVSVGFCKSNNSEFIVATGALRDEGTGLQYTPLAIPAIADLCISDFLKRACQLKKCDFQVGIVHSRDSYYRIGHSDANIKELRSQNFPGVIAFDMNVAATFIVSSVLAKKAGAILSKADKEGKIRKDHIEIAISAMSMIIKEDL